MRWGEIADGMWTLPAGRNKTQLELIRPLSKAALAIVEAQPRNGEFIFSRTGSDPLGGISSAKAALDHASGVSGRRFHDLREQAVDNLPAGDRAIMGAAPWSRPPRHPTGR